MSLLRARFALAIVALASSAAVPPRAQRAAEAAPPVTYPDGYSVQTLEGHRFELLVPTRLDRTQPCSLLLAIQGADDVAQSYSGLLAHGFVVFAPKANAPRNAAGFPSWSAGEAKDIVKILDALSKAFPVAKNRVHAVAYGDAGSILSLIAFGPDSRLVSACFLDAPYRGGSVAPRARNSLGVLAFAGDYEGRSGGRKALDPLVGKVRTLEYRTDASGVGGEYFSMWVRAMEGRFTPGEDLSFPWKRTPVTPAALSANPGKGAVVWLWSPDDAPKPEASVLQTRIFYDEKVRAEGRRMDFFAIDAKAQADALGAFHATVTPMLVVFDGKGVERGRFSGEFDTVPIAKALAAASGKAAR